MEIVDNLGPDFAEVEPNNDVSTGTAFSYPAAATGSIGPGDAIDFYKFTPPVRGVYKFYAEVPENAEIWINPTEARVTEQQQVTDGIRINLTKDTEYDFSIFWRPTGSLSLNCFENYQFDPSYSSCTDGPDEVINYKLYFEFLY